MAQHAYALVFDLAALLPGACTAHHTCLFVRPWRAYRQTCLHPILTTRWSPAHVARAQPQEHLARRFDMRRKRGIVLHGHVNIPKVALYG